MPKSCTSLLYSYLLATKRIPLPTARDTPLTDISPEIDNTIEMMTSILQKERNLIKEVTNQAIETSVANENNKKKEDDDKKALLNEQRKKVMAIRTKYTKNKKWT